MTLPPSLGLIYIWIEGPKIVNSTVEIKPKTTAKILPDNIAHQYFFISLMIEGGEYAFDQMINN